MKHHTIRHQLPVALATSAALAWAVSANAALVFEESFDAGTIGDDAPTAFANVTDAGGAPNYQVTAGLSFGELVTSGNSLGVDRGSGQFNAETNLAGPGFEVNATTATDGTIDVDGTVAVSFLAQASITNFRATQVSFVGPGGQRQFSLGTISANAANGGTEWGLASDFGSTGGNGSVLELSGVTTLDAPVLIAIEIDYNANEIDLYVTDDTSADLSLLTPVATIDASDDGLGLDPSDLAFSSFVIDSGGSPDPQVGDIEFIVDEFRIGGSLAEVLPVPEPGSLALASLGMLLMAARRRP